MLEAFRSNVRIFFIAVLIERVKLILEHINSTCIYHKYVVRLMWPLSIWIKLAKQLLSRTHHLALVG